VTRFGYNEVGDLLSVGVTNSTGGALDYRGYGYNLNGWITNAQRLGNVSASYGCDNIGQLTSAQVSDPGNTPRLNENLTYGYDASGNLAFRTNNTLVQSFTSDPANRLVSVTRSGTLTAAGSLAGAATALGVNAKPAAIYSDATFATTNAADYDKSKR
jgi:hypothetical protein